VRISEVQHTYTITTGLEDKCEIGGLYPILLNKVMLTAIDVGCLSFYRRAVYTSPYCFVSFILYVAIIWR